jgi:enoyl-CoA hydratase/isomerase-like protein
VEGLVVVTAPDGTVTGGDVTARLSSLPCVVIAVDRPPGEVPPLADAVVDEGVASLDDLLKVLQANPVAATSLAMLLRTAGPTLGAGLVSESAVYSLLQGGAEFAAWRAKTPPRATATGDTAPVELLRMDGCLRIVLNRPHVRNALNVAMRDQLLEGLLLANADPSITSVVLSGRGASFCSGGDLGEFGDFADPASSHLLRLMTSIGREIAGLGARIEVQVHGPCAGSGVELAAFAERVVARPDFSARLPEVTLGLIPGAGGTVSIARRIGRHRTALLALSAATIDATTALNWHLVDAIVPA